MDMKAFFQNDKIVSIDRDDEILDAHLISICKVLFEDGTSVEVKATIPRIRQEELTEQTVGGITSTGIPLVSTMPEELNLGGKSTASRFFEEVFETLYSISEEDE